MKSAFGCADSSGNDLHHARRFYIRSLISLLLKVDKDDGQDCAHAEESTHIVALHDDSMPFDSKILLLTISTFVFWRHLRREEDLALQCPLVVLLSSVLVASKIVGCVYFCKSSLYEMYVALRMKSNHDGLATMHDSVHAKLRLSSLEFAIEVSQTELSLLEAFDFEMQVLHWNFVRQKSGSNSVSLELKSETERRQIARCLYLLACAGGCCVENDSLTEFVESISSVATTFQSIGDHQSSGQSTVEEPSNSVSFCIWSSVDELLHERWI